MPSSHQGVELFDLVEQASTYASSHHHPVNRAIHFVFVPMIIYSLFLALCALRVAPLQLSWAGWALPFDFEGVLGSSLAGRVLTLSALAGTPLAPSLGLLITALLFFYYRGLDRTVGTGLGLAFVATTALATWSVDNFGQDERLWQLAAALQVVGWGAQIFIGHAIFEKRSPSLLTSLWQIVVSPFFLALEVAFFLGWNPVLAAAIEKRALQLGAGSGYLPKQRKQQRRQQRPQSPASRRSPRRG